MSVAVATPPLSARLRRLVAEVASEATLTCRFVPGGRLRGAGIVGPNYCATCNQSLMWHEVAASIPLVEHAEYLRSEEAWEGLL